jgi:uncharacterized membrane protein YuzA (DUF378 family)
MKKCPICKLVALLAGIGALNWGLVAVFNVDLVAKLFGSMTTASRIVYGVIGLSGLGVLVSLIRCCPCSGSGGGCETKKPA